MILQHNKQSVVQLFGSESAFEHYHSILKQYWNLEGPQTQSLLDQVATAISDQIDRPKLILPYYRLWIEILAENADTLSFRKLEKHLQRMQSSWEEPELKREYLALKGLIHLENDELEACSVIFPMTENQSSPYCSEFNQRYQLRLSHSSIHSFISECEAPLVDYFHFDSLAKELIILGRSQELQSLLIYVEKNFTESPMRSIFSFFSHLEQDNFKECLEEASHLKQQYPKKSEFQFMYGYISLCCRHIKEAIHTFHKLETTRPQDPDVHSLLGYSHYLKSEGDIYSAHWEKAIDSFVKAEESRVNMNLPTQDLVAIMTTMAEKMNPTANGPVQYWQVELDASHYYSTAFSEEESIGSLDFPSTKKLKSGDLVFFTWSQSSEQTRLRCTYTVKSNSNYDPVDGWMSHLKLIKRFEYPLLLETQKLKGEPTKDNRKGWTRLSTPSVKYVASCVKKLIEEHHDEALTLGDQFIEKIGLRKSS